METEDDDDDGCGDGNYCKTLSRRLNISFCGLLTIMSVS